MAQRPRHGDVIVTGSGTPLNAGTQDREHLRREHGLTRVDAWVVAANKGARKADSHQTGSAARMTKLRARRREAGLVNCEVPITIANAVRAAGGWDAWCLALTEAAVRDDLVQRARQWGLSPATLADFPARRDGWRHRLAWWLLRPRRRVSGQATPDPRI